VSSDVSLAFLDRLRAIDFLVLDVDGVLTDGGIVYGDDGTEFKRFHVRDGSGLAIWRHLGKRAGIISGRTSVTVQRRAAELGISPVIQGATFKVPALRRLLEHTGMQSRQVCVIVDDVPDMGLMTNCGLAVAVADACSEVRSLAHYVTRTNGGRGAVRETVELLLKAQGRWAEILRHYEIPSPRPEAG
jgi:3-deoxy-D-manno-octulosonate 8-phosphate phosphatase (KDO 8-P phosphatase)